MIRNILPYKWIIGGIVLLIIIASACYLWYQHDTAPYRQEAADAEQLLRQSETEKSEKSKVAEQASDAPAESNTPTAEKPITNEVTNDDEVATAEKPQMSPFGLGPLPEIPKEWDAPYLWKNCDDIEDELLTRVIIKMHHDGIRDKYSSVGIDHATGLVIPVEYGTVLVYYETDENGEQRIWSVSGHPADVPPGTIYTRASEIPSHLKIVTEEEIAIDPYEYLGLQKP